MTNNIIRFPIFQDNGTTSIMIADAIEKVRDGMMTMVEINMERPWLPMGPHLAEAAKAMNKMIEELQEAGVL